MFISEIKIKGFRNFKNDTINFKKKTLVIGENDIGKSNLIYALRILLDKTISESDLEPKISDFYVFEETNELCIEIKFSDIIEDCIRAKFKEYISESKELYLSFSAERNKITNEVSYYFSRGYDLESLHDERNRFDSRYYLKVLNLQYVKSNRNLESYIAKEKKNLLVEMIKNRVETEQIIDNEKIEVIKTGLENINSNVRKLSYIRNATNIVNKDLENLSNNNKGRSFQFSATAGSLQDIQNNVELISNVNNRELAIGGDGRNNQIFMSLWCDRHNNMASKPLSITIYCIEEPEAHLYPHQQRQLSKFLLMKLNGQIIISSHSPQIAAEFDAGGIVRLSSQADGSTKSANHGCSDIINSAMDSFGYRMNLIAAETFFSKVVFLVEGPSEEIFYKTMAVKLGIEMDKNGISIVNVNGVGFKEYMSLLNSLNIKYIIRTDNDISKIPYKEGYRCAGVLRGLDFYENYYEKNEELEKIKIKKEILTNIVRKDLSTNEKQVQEELIGAMKKIGIFISDIDLENDIYEAGISEELKAHYSTENKEETIEKMQKKKALNLYGFLQKNEACLEKLKDANILKPLYMCVELGDQNE